jgi:hypothetical protein
VDVLPEETVATRRRLLDRAVKDKALVIGFHLDGVGRVERSNGAYRLRPT